MKQAEWREVLRYKFDNFMARGGASIFISLMVLFAISLLTVIAVRGLLFLIYPAGAGAMDSFFSHIWVIFLELTDPGNMAQDIPSSAAYKVMAILAGMTGVVIFSMLIAFITTSLDQKLNELKKGHSRVLEKNHTLILGWNERVVEIIRELLEANESERDPSLVILDAKEKEEMDDYLANHLKERKNTRVVTRSGNTASLTDLQKVAIGECRSVIVLANCAAAAPEEDKESSDARVIKTVLAVIASRPEGKTFNIVAEVFSAAHRMVVEEISPDEITTVDTLDVLAKILVQTSRSSGLALVYNEIFGFEGSEMYFHKANWGSVSFGQLQFHFPDGVVMGLRHADGTLALNPEPATTLAADDEIIILAEDDSTIDFRPAPVVTPREIPLKEAKLEPKVERQLILGWNAKVTTIIEQYADYVLEGSQIDILIKRVTDEIRQTVAGLQAALPTIRIRLMEKNPMVTQNLIEIEPFNYNNVIILSQSGDFTDPEKIDAETIIILLLLRKVFKAHPEEAASTQLITEVMDSENQQLIASAGVHDFIISNRMVSKLFAQISEDADVKDVYDDLFQEEGSEIYLKPAWLYFNELPADVAFADLMLLTQKRAEVCLGLKLAKFEDDPEHNFGVIVNPPDKTVRYMITAEDSLVVLAENDT